MEKIAFCKSLLKYMSWIYVSSFKQQQQQQMTDKLFNFKFFLDVIV